MGRRFADLAFTDSVKAAQQRYGSREANQGHEQAPEPRDRIGPAEAEFIAQRDSLYLASVGEGGWPYVQHRGGPRGFLKVLDERTLGFADYRGNRQYISVGNLGHDGRVSLILMDYPNRRRLKIWAYASLVHAEEDPALLARLQDDDYRARVERGIVLRVEAIDWNCPQHITPRYSEDELAPRLAALQAEHEAQHARLQADNAALRAQLQALTTTSTTPSIPAPSPSHTEAADDATFVAVLQRSGQRLHVPAGQSLLDVLLRHGHDIPYSCRLGECATCVVPVVAGEALHRDEVLSDAERARGSLCSCVSRGRGELVLDL